MAKEDTTTGTTNFAPNPSFETYTGTQDDGVSDTFTSWDSVNFNDGLGNKIEATATAYSGSNAVKITYTTSRPYIRPTIAVKGSTTYKLSFYTRGDGTAQGLYGIWDTVNSKYLVSLIGTGVTGTTYTKVEKLFTTEANTVNIYPELYGPNSAGTVYFDLVELYDTAGNVMDLTPQSNVGVRTGTTWTTDRKGQSNKALSFNGTSDYVQMGASPITGNVDFSMSTWLYPTVSSDDFGGFVIGTGGTARQSAFIGSGAGKIFGGLYGVNYDSGVSSVNTWRHAVITYTKSTEIFRLYVDGVQVNSGGAGTANITGNMSIGKFLSGTGYFFEGKIQDPRVYNKVLTLTEIKTLYNSYNPQISFNSLNKGLIGHWALDKSNTTTGTTNRVTNGTFTTDSNWVKGTGWSISGGTANCDGSQTANTSLQQNSVNVIGEVYKINFTISNYSAGGLRLLAGSNATSFLTANGNYEYVLTQNTNTAVILQGNADFIGSIDNVTVYDVTGNVMDLTPQSNTGTRIGTTWTTDRKGQVNKALLLNGTTGFIGIGNKTSVMPTQAVTVSAWVNASALNDFRWIAGTQSAVNATDGYMLYWNNNVLRFAINLWSGSYGQITFHSTRLNEWVHVVGTYDKVNTKIYLNGVLGTAGNLTADINYPVGSSLSIGKVGAGNSYYWNGAIDDVRIYNRALSQTEVTQLYNYYR